MTPHAVEDCLLLRIQPIGVRRVELLQQALILVTPDEIFQRQREQAGA